MWTGTINLIPEAQKQTRFVFRGSRPIAYDPSKKYKESIIWQLLPFKPEKLITGPVEMELHFYMPIPQSTSMIRRKEMLNGTMYHIKKPDLDNLAYVVTNALKNLVYKDDSQIVVSHYYKQYAEKPKITIKIININEEIRKTYDNK